MISLLQGNKHEPTYISRLNYKDASLITLCLIVLDINIPKVKHHQNFLENGKTDFLTMIC